jgi:chitodextrinase
MPRQYSVVFAATTVAAASGDVDWFELTPADDKPLEIVGLFIAVTSELGDAADEWVPFQILRGHTTSGSGGSAPTPAALDSADGAAGFASEVLNTTVASTTTPIILHSDAVNVRIGYQMWWPDGYGPKATQANTTLVVRQMAAVADDVTMTGTLYVRES